MIETYSKEIGQLVVIWITGMLGNYIGEITKANPMEIKVMEDGPFAYLRDGDFLIRDNCTILLQEDDKHDTSTFLLQEEAAGRKVISGLKRLGVEDGKLHYIYSSKEAEFRYLSQLETELKITKKEK